jgi:hypothetical protein
MHLATLTETFSAVQSIDQYIYLRSIAINYKQRREG